MKLKERVIGAFSVLIIASNIGAAAHATTRAERYEISGPLRTRQITNKIIPEHVTGPNKKMVSVRIYFTVDNSGNVRPNLRVTKTSGDPYIDQLGMNALKQWKFAPASGKEGHGEWGIVAFLIGS